MKNIKFLLLIIIAVFAASCEDVVDVDLNTAPPRLVVDASINWVKGTDGTTQSIKLTTTTGYYEEEIPVASGAVVQVTNSTGTIFNFAEEPGTGIYTCTNFEPVIGETYTLNITWQDQQYTATETLYAVPDITEIVQENDAGFFGEDIEVRIKWMDNGAEDNFYMVRFDTEVLPYPDYDVLDDEFFQGNEMFNFIWNEDFEAGQNVGIKFYGISEKHFNYMNILISISEGGSGGGPFQTPPVTVRGNVINTTNEDNYPLGYFRLSEVVETNYTIQ